MERTHGERTAGVPRAYAPPCLLLQPCGLLKQLPMFRKVLHATADRVTKVEQLSPTLADSLGLLPLTVNLLGMLPRDKKGLTGICLQLKSLLEPFLCKGTELTTMDVGFLQGATPSPMRAKARAETMGFDSLYDPMRTRAKALSGMAALRIRNRLNHFIVVSSMGALQETPQDT